jgi:hypothetical protein
MPYDASDKSLRRQAMFLQAATVIIVAGTVLNYLRTGEVVPFLFALFGERSYRARRRSDGFLKGLALALPSFLLRRRRSGGGRHLWPDRRGRNFQRPQQRRSSARSAAGCRWARSSPCW